MTAEELFKEIKALPEGERTILLKLIEKGESETPCDFESALSEVMHRYEKSLRELSK
jgi:hypothetical protein